MNIYVLHFIVALTVTLKTCRGRNEIVLTNSSDPGKDMYVIHAMVYQVGIITNNTNDEMSNSTGRQEMFSIYQQNGTKLNLTGLNPILTNVTAQSIVGVAPVINQSQLPLPFQLSQLPISNNSMEVTLESMPTTKRIIRSSATNKATPLEMEEGVTTLQKNASIKSLTLPPLVALNTNFSHIPVPIPNTSVVRYAKINTVFKKD